MGIAVTKFDEPAGTILIRVAFRPDSSGIARDWLPFDLFGTLLRYTALVPTVGVQSNYGVTLKDVYGADVLLGDISGAATGATPIHGDITAAISTRGQRPVVVGGRHLFEFDGANNTPGVFELHMTRDLAARYDHRGLTR